MELRTLRYFLAVAREENMTEAANVLHVTQPTLSRQIADLERELGVELFERTNRSCVLTSDGMRLRQRAEEIVLLMEQTEQELADRELGIAGVIRIGAGETKSIRLVLDVFAELHRSYPGVTIELYTGNADAVEERLERACSTLRCCWNPLTSRNTNGFACPRRTESVPLSLRAVHGVAGMC